jgi:DNA-binding MarR family transcriptional regulator
LPTQVIPRPATKRRLKPAELRAWREFMLASVVVTRALDRDLQRQADMTLAEHHLLAIINEADPQGIRPTDLQLLSTLTKSGLTRAVDRLEALGLITSRVCPTDGRGQLLVLSAKGRQKLRRTAPEFFRSVARHFADHLTERETETLTNALGRVGTAGRG